MFEGRGKKRTTILLFGWRVLGRRKGKVMSSFSPWYHLSSSQIREECVGLTVSHNVYFPFSSTLTQQPKHMVGKICSFLFLNSLPSLLPSFLSFLLLFILFRAWLGSNASTTWDPLQWRHMIKKQIYIIIVMIQYTRVLDPIDAFKKKKRSFLNE